MSNITKVRIRLAALTLGAAALLAPVTFSSGTQAITPNDACADGVCCREFGSVCEVDGDLRLGYYETASCKVEDE